MKLTDSQIKNKIMVVDDEEKVCWAFEQFLTEEGYGVIVASNAQEALSKLSEEKPDLVIMDVRMPGMDGIDALAEMKRIDPEVYVIIMTAYGDMQTAIRAMQAGAYDYIIKPIDLDQVHIVIQKALKNQNQSREIELLRSELIGKYQRDNIVGKSKQIQDIYKMIGTLTTNDVTVLIQGETGVGKELVAKAIHYNSPRKNKPFVSINCVALSETLLESELFGHEKGAFTGAITSKQGKFEIAQDGTIFLDEIGDISYNMQTKLLRVLDDRTFERVGSNRKMKMNARIIASTNKDLGIAVRTGEFRADLYYRLRVVSIFIPPLRERKEDIPLLAQHFLGISNEDLGKQIKGIDPKVIRILMEYNWPGNVRELENMIKSAVALCKGEIILPEHLPINADGMLYQNSSYAALDLALKELLEEKLKSGSPKPYDEITEYVARFLVDTVIQKVDKNQVKAASILGISRTTLRRKLKPFRE